MVRHFRVKVADFLIPRHHRYHGRCVHILATDAKELEDQVCVMVCLNFMFFSFLTASFGNQGLDFECARCCERDGRHYRHRLLPFKCADEWKSDDSKKGRVVPSMEDYEELKESASALAVRPVELDVAEWGMVQVKELLQELLVLNHGVLRPGGCPLAETCDHLLPLKLLNRVNLGLAFGLDLWDDLISPCISIWCLQVNQVCRRWRGSSSWWRRCLLLCRWFSSTGASRKSPLPSCLLPPARNLQTMLLSFPCPPTSLLPIQATRPMWILVWEVFRRCSCTLCNNLRWRENKVFHASRL